MNIDFLSPDCRIENGFLFSCTAFRGWKKKTFLKYLKYLLPFPLPHCVKLHLRFFVPFFISFYDDTKT